MMVWEYVLNGRWEMRSERWGLGSERWEMRGGK